MVRGSRVYKKTGVTWDCLLETDESHREGINHPSESQTVVAMLTGKLSVPNTALIENDELWA